MQPTDEDAELENPDNWDYESAKWHPGVPAEKRRTIVSVAFPSQDFQTVAEYARAEGMKLSEFIRVAALNAALGTNGADVAVAGVAGHVVVEESKAAPSTRPSSQVVHAPESGAEYTSSVA